MPYCLEDRKRVFLATRGIFAGQNALVRKQKKVRDIILKHEDELREVLDEMGVDKVVDVAKGLLELQMFQSQEKASVMFPDLFPREDVEVDDASADERDEVESDGVPIKSEDEGCRPAQGSSVDTSNNCNSRSGITSLHPVYLPFKTQHVMLSKVQAVLEDACFDFISKHLPSLLTGDSHDYDCGAALELNKWTGMLLEHESEFPTKLAGKQLAKVISDSNKLRDTAVHRERITAREVMDLLVAAVRLSEALCDSVRTAQLGRLLYGVGEQIRTMKRHKNFLEDDLRMKMEDLRRRREALDREEKELFEGVARKDEEHKALIGHTLEKAMGKLFLEESDDPGCNNVEDGLCLCNGFIIRDDSDPNAVGHEPTSKPEPEYML